ncbi:MAG TPA: heparinase II/III family protein, partial [Candidatus Tectomicrobia bacterium]
MPPRISRSRMRHISHSALFAALDLTHPTLYRVQEATQAHRWKAAYEAWGRYFARRATPPHLLEPPAEQQALAALRDAERVVQHEIQGWHSLTYTFGPRVDFNAEWGRSGKYGMHYWDWSVPLKLAFEQTGDLRYARCFDDLFNQWYTQRDAINNPIPHLDVIFYELGLGVRTPCFIDHYFTYRNTGILQWRSQARLLKTILGACRWLNLSEQEGYRVGNWQMCGSWALVYAGSLLPEFREAQDWLKIGVQRLVEHMEQDFYADGGHYERAAGYGAWCTRLSADLLRFSAWYPQLTVPDSLRQCVVRMYDWFLATATPLAEAPGFNDSPVVSQDDFFQQAARGTGAGRFLWPLRGRCRS